MRRSAEGFKVRLARHDAADRITRCTAVAYDPKAECPHFMATLASSLPDADERAAWHRMMGYCATGLIEEQAFFMNQGPGQDGKSTLLDAVRETEGSYAATAKVETFLDGISAGGSGPQPDLIALAGDTRLAIVSEPKRGAKLNEGLLKAWTGGSPVSARDLNAKPISFAPRAKLVFEMNSFPVAKGDDDGIWRRIKPYLFRRKVPDAEVDRQLPVKLRGEMAGILNWLVAGVGDWSVQGLALPETLRKVLEDYRRSSSPFGDWLHERCVFGAAATNPETGEDYWTASSVLLNAFKDWWEDQGNDRDKAMGPKAFGDALRDRQVMGRKDRKGNKIRGPIRLKTLEEREADLSGAETVSVSVGDQRGTSPSAIEEPGAFDITDRGTSPSAIEEPGAFDITDDEWERRDDDGR
jgi:putative DNA primase/helicase